MKDSTRVAPAVAAQRLTNELRHLARAVVERPLVFLAERAEGAIGRLTDHAEGTGSGFVESIDIGAPVEVVYDRWARSPRMRESEIVEQVPGHRFIWRSERGKGRVDGAVTFHELAPGLTRVMLVLEYHPQGLIERVDAIWGARGRRARLELKHFARQVMTETMLHPDETAADGRRGEIRDGEVVKDRETAPREERPARPVRAEEPSSRPVRRRPAARRA